jgi:hypothetical protein
MPCYLLLCTSMVWFDFLAPVARPSPSDCFAAEVFSASFRLHCAVLVLRYAKFLVSLCLPVWNWLMRKYL